MRLLSSSILFVFCFGVYGLAQAGNAQSMPLVESAAKTLYVSAAVDTLDATKFMLDTGSGYTTINQKTYDALKQLQRIHFVKKILGLLADGSQRQVNIWRVDSITLNGSCKLQNIEVAVLPGTSRQILGLATLRKAAPFTISVDPPTLSLSNCG